MLKKQDSFPLINSPRGVGRQGYFSEAMQCQGVNLLVLANRFKNPIKIAFFTIFVLFLMYFQ